jgi:purine-nucleoside/S-methyl-5'-thioadenosine phosphorylase / adenosine deaminase
MLEPIEAASLAGLPGIRHGFFTRVGGVSEGIYAGLNCGPGSSDAPANVAENRVRVVRHLGGNHSDVVTLYQIHSGDALVVDAPVAADARPKADAVVTNTPGLVVGVLTADCAPVLFADPEAKVVGAAHAGWRGAVSGVLEAAIAAMEGIGARRNRIVAAIGPAINQVSYEVGPDFEEALLKSCPSNGMFLARKSPHERAHFDLPGFAEMRLRAAGIGKIEQQSACTYANDSLFFSFRRSQHRSEPDYGRQISAIVVA